MVTTTEFTKSAEQQELTLDELDQVSGGNPAVVGFVLGYLGTKVGDLVWDNSKGVIKSIYDKVTAGK